MIIKWKKVSGCVIFVFILLAFGVSAAKINSSSYKQIIAVSTGGENATGASYKTYTAIGIINWIVNSTSYINKLGFFHLWLLANDQPCAAASQCEGGFCCSSKCKSSACPTEEAQPSGGGGGGAAAGGGGGGALIPLEVQEEPTVKDFSISPSSFKEELVLGAAKTRTIKIKNEGNSGLTFNLNVLTVDNFVFLSEDSFSLEPNEEKDVEANIIGKRLGSYLGEIEVTADGIKKSVTVIVEVESERVLFDVKMDIPSAYKEIRIGEELKAQITLLNIGPPRKVDVITTYLIKDKRGNVIYESSETFAVEKQASFVKSIRLPYQTGPGEYLAIVELTYENSFAVSSELFRIVSKEEGVVQKTVKSNAAFAFVFAIIVGLMLLFMYLLFPKLKNYNKR